MRYRAISDLTDFSQDVAVAMDFIGHDAYSASLEAIGTTLNAKGFVSAYDDTRFALELELLNLDRLRERCSGNFTCLPPGCHAGVDFLLGVGQTVSHLSPAAQKRLAGRIRKGLKEGLWALHHELHVAANLSKRGWDVYFHDLEEDGGYDFLATRDRAAFEVEAKAVSTFTGWPITPDALNKLLVEIKQDFTWTPDATPLLRVVLSSHLPTNRAELRLLVEALCEATESRAEVILPSAHISFVGLVPSPSAQELGRATWEHAQGARSIVLCNPTQPRLVLELHSERPVQLGRKIIRTITETAREQFSESRPGVVWTRLEMMPNDLFKKLSTSTSEEACFLDKVASAALLSPKRRHLRQLVFSGGSTVQNDGTKICSAAFHTVYNSPLCTFSDEAIFPEGRVSSYAPEPG